MFKVFGSILSLRLYKLNCTNTNLRASGDGGITRRTIACSPKEAWPVAQTGMNEIIAHTEITHIVIFQIITITSDITAIW